MTIFFPSIVTNGLVLCLDAGNQLSYPGTGTTWNDLSRNGNNGTLTNGPVFNSGGSMVFDGVNDYCAFNYYPSDIVSVSVWMNLANAGNFPIILAGDSTQYQSSLWKWSMFSYSNNFYIRGNAGELGNINTPTSTLVNKWTNWVLIRNDKKCQKIMKIIT